MTRTAFLQPTFDPTAYLSSLTSSPRFQTLSDLHAELKALSSHLTTELVDLVNDDYEQFLSLGASLRGGEEKTEEVRVGLMGFQRDVEGVKRWVEERSGELEKLMGELRALRRERNLGRGLLEVERRVGELEEGLGLRSALDSQNNEKTKLRGDEEDEWADWDDREQNFDSEDSDEEADENVVPPRLKRRIEDYVIIRVLSSKLAPDHPFLVSQRDRMFKIRSALLVELEGAMRNAQHDDARKQVIRLKLSLDEQLPVRSTAST